MAKKERRKNPPKQQPWWRRLLCAIGLHAHWGTSTPHTYKCKYCPDVMSGHY